MPQSTYKAERRTIYLGDIPLEVAMLPNGDYCLSQSQVAGAIDKDQNSIRRFYASKYFKAISDNGFELDHFQEKLVLEGSNKPISPVSFDVAYLYWQKWAIAGNKKAQGLVVAMVQYSLQKQQSMLVPPIIRELKLRIRLAELELEKARIEQRLLEKAVIHNQEDFEWSGLKFTTWDEVEQFIEENFGEEKSQWLPLEVAGEILIVPWDEFQAELN